MRPAILGWGVGLLIAALLFMVRSDTIGLIGGGVIGIIGIILIIVGIKGD